MIDKKFKELIPNEGCIGLIVGDIRFGKSCLGYGLLEFLSKEYNRKAYIFALPKEKVSLLPEFITPIYEINDIQEGSVVIFDEAYISFYARKSMSDLNKMMDILAGLVGQKDIMTIYITQQTRRLEIGIVSAVNWLFFKKPSLLQSKFDRYELRNVIKEVYDKFDSLTPPAGMTKKDYQKRCTYVMTGDFVDMIENSNTPPEWWNEQLSKTYKGIVLDGERTIDIGVEEPTLDKTAIEELPMKEILDELENKAKQYKGFFEQSQVEIHPAILEYLYEMGQLRKIYNTKRYIIYALKNK